MNKYNLVIIALLLCSGIISAQDQDSLFNKFTPQTLLIDGYKINVETLGTGDPIFFFAGGPGNSHDYLQGNFGQYYRTHKVVFIDMLGRGLSDDAKDVSEYSIANDVHVAEEIRKKLQLTKISLVGHSYGTVVAQAYAIAHPDKVDKMVLINGFHSGEMWQANCDSYNHYCKTHYPEYWEKIDSMRSLGYVSSDPAFSKLYGSVPVKYVYYHNTKLKQNSPSYKHRGWASDVYYGIIGRDADFFVSGSMMDTDFRKDLRNLSCPTLVIAGRYDGVSTPEYAMQYKNYMPQAQFVMFEQSGHNPYLEEPEKFYQILDEFLATNK